MNEPSAATITEQVLRRLEGTPDPRLRHISEALVRHLHAFIREIRPSIQEWEQAIEFLTAVGRSCISGRQEFILLSDTLGASMLVDEINASDDPRATESTVLGPFYVDNAPRFELGAVIDAGKPGVPLFIEGKVFDTEGNRCSGATVDVWQSDSEGSYDVQHPESTSFLRGRFTCDESGKFELWSIVPSSYAIPDDGPVGRMLDAQGRHPYRPAHVHFRISSPGCSMLTTHIFVKGDEYLRSDAVFGVKSSLIEDLPLHDPGDAPKGRKLNQPFAQLRRTFVLARIVPSA
ncbi:MAG TPA: dioxygenase [Acidimicrobiales bacterium]|nr:dioxygenase [Acidimicrobiales bacterium]